MTIRWYEQSLTDVPALDDWLGPWETSHLSGLRVPKRRADWRLGRWTAKCALADHLALSNTAEIFSKIEIRPTTSGAPEAFVDDIRANISISLSHSDGFAVCALGPRETSFGCDLELIEARGNAFVADYFTSQEQFLIREAAEKERSALITLIWSAKESTLKALRTGLRSDTRSVSVAFVEGLRERNSPNNRHSAGQCSVDFAESNQIWRSLIVCYETGGSFPGCWLLDNRFARTVVQLPSP